MLAQLPQIPSHSLVTNENLKPSSGVQRHRQQKVARTRCKASPQASSHHDDCAHVFGEKSYIAGIPTSSKVTAVGKRLRLTLRNRPHEFVNLAIQEIEEIVARPESHSVESGNSQRRRRTQDFDPPTSSHYATVRRRLVDSLSNPAGVDSTGESPESEARGILDGGTKFEELADVIYFWALGEAYLQHPQMQADMRKRLKRAGDAPLAAGDDRIELRSRVQLMEGAWYEGQYMIGSVNFVRSPGTNPNEGEESSSSGGVSWGGEGVTGASELPLPNLDHIWKSDNGRMMMATEGENPTRMMRQGAARSYDTYQKWGYFQRRMSISRSKDANSDEEPLQGVGGPGQQPPQARSSYGTSHAPWRFFESVPDQLSSMRTNEAAEVANRHLRALFGDLEECITTLQAFQQMTCEAKWFGRALYDAEDIVLQTCCSLLAA